MEHEFVRICANAQRSQTRNSLSAVQRQTRGQWIERQHHPTVGYRMWSMSEVYLKFSVIANDAFVPK